MPPDELLNPTDADLLRRSASGDTDAFDAFVQRHQAAVFRYLGSVANDPADAEDAMQEAFLSAWKGAAGFRGESSARGWILTVARHALSRQHRRRAGEPAEFVPLDRLGLEAGWGSADTPEDAFARMEERAIVAEVLGGLSEQDREILILRDLEGLSGRAVAEALGVGVPAMKSRLHRARLRLLAAGKEVLRAGA